MLGSIKQVFASSVDEAEIRGSRYSQNLLKYCIYGMKKVIP